MKSISNSKYRKYSSYRKKSENHLIEMNRNLLRFRWFFQCWVPKPLGCIFQVFAPGQVCVLIRFARKTIFIFNSLIWSEIITIVIFNLKIRICECNTGGGSLHHPGGHELGELVQLISGSSGFYIKHLSQKKSPNWDRHIFQTTSVQLELL